MLGNRFVVVGVATAGAAEWRLDLSSDTKVEQGDWQRVLILARSQPDAIFLAPLPSHVLVPLVSQLRGLPKPPPIIASLGKGQGQFRQALKDAGATDILDDPGPDEASLALRLVLGDKSGGGTVWPATTYDAEACAASLRHYVATSQVQDAKGSVRFADLLSFCRGLTESDRDALLSGRPSLRLTILVTELRLHGVLRSVPTASGPPAALDASALQSLRAEVDATQAEIRSAFEGDPQLKSELEPRSLGIESRWQEIEQSRQLVASREVTRPATPPPVRVTPRDIPRVRTEMTPLPAARKLPRHQALAVTGVVFALALGAAAWEVWSLFVPERAPSKLRNIPAVKEVTEQSGRAVIWVEDGWVADAAHLEALEKDLSQRGIFEADVFTSAHKRVAQIKIPHAAAAQ